MPSDDEITRRLDELQELVGGIAGDLATSLSTPPAQIPPLDPGDPLSIHKRLLAIAYAVAAWARGLHVEYVALQWSDGVTMNFEGRTVRIVHADLGEMTLEELQKKLDDIDLGEEDTDAE